MLLTLLLAATACVALSPEQCDKTLGDEIEYSCRDGNATLTLASRKNDYVRIICEDSTISCENAPRFDFASNLTLKSLGVQGCSPSILRCVNSIVAATSFEIVTLKDMQGELTKEDVESLGDVRVLMMQQSAAQKYLPIEAIRSLPTLRDLRIGGGNFQLSANMFTDTPTLKYLELSKDNISSIPAHSFHGLGTLNELNLWGNDVTDVHTGAFIGLDSLTRLTLNTNKLQHIEVGTFSSLTKLEALVMTDNMLEMLPNGLFEGLNSLENVTIQMNRVELKLDTATFSQLPSLKNIIIKYSGLTYLPEDLFNNTTNVINIDFRNNKIAKLSSKVFLSLSNLRRLDLSYNKIMELPKGLFAGMKKLEYLNLNRNLIEVLADHTFSGPSNLKEVYIDYNSITSIAGTAFQGVPLLHTLSLTSNKLSLNPEQKYLFLDTYTPSPFQSLTRLRKLNLSGNEIRTIFYDWQNLMLNLEVLDLSWNHFSSLAFGSQETLFLSNKLTVDLSHNKILHVLLDPPGPNPNTTLSNTKIILDDNPINCDCSNYGLRLRANGNRYYENEPTFVLENTRCASPFNLKGEILKDIPPKDFVCQLPQAEIPNNCSKSIANVANNELIFNCEYIPEKLPDTKSDNISYYFIQEPTITLNLQHQPRILDTQNVYKINLSNAGLEEIDFRPTKSLKILDLSNNMLKTVPMQFLDSDLKELYLSNNPLECECWYADNIAALLRSSILADLPQITCSNGDKIAQIDATALCNTWKATMAALGTFVTLGICVVAASILIYKYSNEILVYMTTRGLCKCCITEIQQDKDKEYDVFVSFAHQDLDLVQDKLLPKLEGEFGQKVCIHYRDWTVGEMIPAQIMKSVENSKKTIIILSKSFLESVWANMEFCAAHNLALQDGKARVILILLDENISKHEKLSDELKAYISTNTYLLWSDVKFWEKLNKVLPRIEHRFTWLEVLRSRNNSNDTKIKSGLYVKINNEGKLVNLGIVGKDKDLNNMPCDLV